MTPVSGNDSSYSDKELTGRGGQDRQRRPSLLDESSRRLLVLATIRPSKTFYRDLPEADVDHLMAYFRKMRNTNRRLTSEEINQDLKATIIEYKPKMC